MSHASPHHPATIAPGTVIELDRGVACDRFVGSRREWLVTSGHGDYALGTANGLATRRYHGLLVAASEPPIRRRMLVPFIDEEVSIGAARITLATRRWADGTVEPDGDRVIAAFRLEDGIPTTSFEIGSARLERRVFMLRDLRATCVAWTLVDAEAPISLDARVFVEHRNHHALDPDAAWLPEVSVDDGEGAHATITLPANSHAASSTVLRAAANDATLARASTWWRRHALEEERARGYDNLGSACHALTASLVLRPGETRALIIGLASPALDSVLEGGAFDATALLGAERARRRALVAAARAEHAPIEVRSLVLSADDFLVTRSRVDGSAGRSIIAGFPWFEDWARDAFLALPGLLVATNRHVDAKLVIDTFLDHLDGGLLPNRFPDERGDVEFNAADAPLLAIAAAERVRAASGDDEWFNHNLPRFLAIIDAYLAGTRHGIAVGTDGLVTAAADGLQLTWMDAKVGDLVVTPRRGKPIELSALWLHALEVLGRFVRRTSSNFARASQLDLAASRTRASVARYWNPDTRCFLDVIEASDEVACDAGGHDTSIRPNQLFLLALCPDAVPAGWRDDALASIATELLVPLAVRTLARSDARFRGRYEGDQRSRDLAYHNGTAWPFLLGLAIRAMRHARSPRAEAALNDLRRDLSARLVEGGIGSLPEIMDGDAPHAPRGCPMQAWSVGCILEVLLNAETRP
jgi:predicted glycogen debranching enzyme